MRQSDDWNKSRWRDIDKEKIQVEEHDEKVKIWGAVSSWSQKGESKQSGKGEDYPDKEKRI